MLKLNKKIIINDKFAVIFAVLLFSISGLSIIMYTKDFNGEAGSSGMALIIFFTFMSGCAFLIHGIKIKNNKNI